MRYAYLGPEGTFTEAALLSIPEAADGELLPQVSVVAAIEAARTGAADAAVVPLENSVEGSVASTVDELVHGEPVVIRREVMLPVGFSLLVREGTSLPDIAVVATHPHAEAQCRRWLREHVPQARVDFTSSTAYAASAVAAGEFDAAVSAPIAGERYGLTSLADDIGDNRGAVTRFVVLTPPAAPLPRTGRDKTSLVAFIRENHTGALLEVLTEFATRGINLTRIESRPTKSQFGQYCFALDCDGHLADARVGDALAALKRICADVRFLGSYPRVDGGDPIKPPDGRADEDFEAAAEWVRRLRGA